MFRTRQYARAGSLQILGSLHYALQLIQEPLVNLCQLMYPFHVIPGPKSLAYNKYALVSRLTQCLVYIWNHKFLILRETMHALSDHPQAFLDCLLKSASDCHNLSHGLHG